MVTGCLSVESIGISFLRQKAGAAMLFMSGIYHADPAIEFLSP